MHDNNFKLHIQNEKELQLTINGIEVEEYLKNTFNHLHIVKGEVSFVHEFGEQIGQIEIDSNEMKCLKGDYYILCNAFYLPRILSFMKAFSPI